MEHTTNLDVFLWGIIGLMGSTMTTFLILGWLKGMYWERQLKLKRRHR
ncbi:hypothetical protein [Polluticoccus soli]|nr:hypothetical protein [Flavipsychrobacter sp. JY13-12]